MKRSRLQRSSTPLRRSAAPKRTKPPKPKRGGDRIPESVRAVVRERSEGRCERCHYCLATQMHHRVTRARGGLHHPLNLAHLCAGPGSCDCHGIVHRTNEHPWLLRGRFLRGVYEGPYSPFVAIFGQRDDRRSA